MSPISRQSRNDDSTQNHGSKKTIPSIKLDQDSEVNSELATQTSFDRLPNKTKAIDQILQQNKARRENNRRWKRQKKDLKQTKKGFQSAEQLSSKMNVIKNKLDHYLSQRIQPPKKRRKKKQTKQSTVLLSVPELDEERKSIRKYKRIGVNSKWMREAVNLKRQEAYQEEEIVLERVSVEVKAKLAQEVNQETPKQGFTNQIHSKPENTDEIIDTQSQEKPDSKKDEIEIQKVNNQVPQQPLAQSEKTTKTFEDVRVLGQFKKSQSKQPLSIKSKMISGFASGNFGYNSEFDKSNNPVSTEVSPQVTSHVIGYVKNETPEEDELLSLLKAVEDSPKVVPARKLRKDISMSVLKHRDYLILNDRISEISSVQDEEQILDIQKNKSIPLNLIEPSKLFDIQKEKERIKYELLLKKEEEIKRKINKQKQKELMEMLHPGKDPQYATFELDGFLKEMESINGRLQDYMSKKKDEIKQRKKEQREKEMIKQAEFELQKEEKIDSDSRRDKLSQMENDRYQKPEVLSMQKDLESKENRNQTETDKEKQNEVQKSSEMEDSQKNQEEQTLKEDIQNAESSNDQVSDQDEQEGTDDFSVPENDDEQDQVQGKDHHQQEMSDLENNDYQILEEEEELEEKQEIDIAKPDVNMDESKNKNTEHQEMTKTNKVNPELLNKLEQEEEIDKSTNPENSVMNTKTSLSQDKIDSYELLSNANSFKILPENLQVTNTLNYQRASRQSSDKQKKEHSKKSFKSQKSIEGQKEKNKQTESINPSKGVASQNQKVSSQNKDLQDEDFYLEDTDTEDDSQLTEFQQRQKIMRQLKELTNARKMLEGLDKMTVKGRRMKLSREYNQNLKKTHPKKTHLYKKPKLYNQKVLANDFKPKTANHLSKKKSPNNKNKSSNELSINTHKSKFKSTSQKYK